MPLNINQSLIKEHKTKPVQLFISGSKDIDTTCSVAM